MSVREAETVPGISNRGDRIYAVGLKSTGGARSWFVVQRWINAANCYQPGARQVDRCVLIACGFYATGLAWALATATAALPSGLPPVAATNSRGECWREVWSWETVDTGTSHVFGIYSVVTKWTKLSGVITYSNSTWLLYVLGNPQMPAVIIAQTLTRIFLDNIGNRTGLVKK